MMNEEQCSAALEQVKSAKYRPRYWLMPPGMHNEFVERGFAETEIDGHMWIDLGEQNNAGEK